MPGAAPRARRNLADRLRPLRRISGPIEAFQVRRFGRSALSMAFRTPVLVLDSTGRRSGRTRSTTLAYHRDGDGSLLVVGGAGGQSRLPDWVANLRANPEASVTVDGTTFAVSAVELEAASRDDAWTTVRRIWPRVDTYEARAGRPVPVFRLRPR